MAIKNIVAKGIGFSPGSIKWIVTHGFGSAVPAAVAAAASGRGFGIAIPKKLRKGTGALAYIPDEPEVEKSREVTLEAILYASVAFQVEFVQAVPAPPKPKPKPILPELILHNHRASIGIMVEIQLVEWYDRLVFIRQLDEQAIIEGIL